MQLPTRTGRNQPSSGNITTWGPPRLNAWHSDVGGPDLRGDGGLRNFFCTMTTSSMQKSRDEFCICRRTSELVPPERHSSRQLLVPRSSDISRSERTHSQKHQGRCRYVDRPQSAAPEFSKRVRQHLSHNNANHRRPANGHLSTDGIPSAGFQRPALPNSHHTARRNRFRQGQSSLGCTKRNTVTSRAPT